MESQDSSSTPNRLSSSKITSISHLVLSLTARVENLPLTTTHLKDSLAEVCVKLKSFNPLDESTSSDPTISTRRTLIQMAESDARTIRLELDIVESLLAKISSELE